MPRSRDIPTISSELRKKFKNPRAALAALGLDQRLLDVPRKLAFDGASAMPTRLEYLAVKSCARAINPLLAMDAKVNYGPIFKGLTTHNLGQRKEQIVQDVKRAIRGKTIARDASVAHLAKLLDHLEESPEKTTLDKSVSGAQHRAMEAAAHGHSNLGIPKKVGQEFEKKDKGHHFDSARSANLGKWLRSRGASDDSVKRIYDMIRDELPENALDEQPEENEIEIEIGENDEEEEAQDRRRARDSRRRARDGEIEQEEGEGEEIEEEEAEDNRNIGASEARDRRRRARDGEIEQEEGEGEEVEEEEAEDLMLGEGGRDRRHGRDGRHAKDRHARDRRHGMDAKKPVTVDEMTRAITAASRDTERRMRLAMDARDFVRPYVGELPRNLRSADEIHRAAAVILDIPDAETIHPSALKTLIKMQPEAGARANAYSGYAADSGLAMDGRYDDEDGGRGFSGRWPGASRIGNA